MISLIKYREHNWKDYVYFYTVEDKVVSPYFDSEEQATEWLKEKNENLRPNH